MSGPGGGKRHKNARRIVLPLIGGVTLFVIEIFAPLLIDSGDAAPFLSLVGLLVVLVAVAELLRLQPEAIEPLASLLSAVARRLRLRTRPRRAPRQARRWIPAAAVLRRLRVLVAHVVVIAGFAASAWLATTWVTTRVAPGWGEPCGRPLELRVLTSAENRDIIRRLADEFAVSPENNRGCRLAHITLSTQSSAEVVRQAFLREWSGPSSVGTDSPVATLLGARPDVWLPASTAEVEHVLALRPRDAELEVMGSLAYTPMVFAAPKRYRQRIESQLPQAGSPSWRDLIDAAVRSGLTVARPDPGLSVAGLLATVDLYRGIPRGDTQALRDLERRITSLGTPVSGLRDLLCTIRTSGASTTAVIATEQAWLDYERGEPLGDGCPRPGGRPPVSYHAFHPADAHGADHPFVRVTWGKEADPRRDEAIDRWRRWLAERLASAGGYRSTAGQAVGDLPPIIEPEVPVRRFRGQELARTLEEFPSARQAVTLAFIVDRSGSMNKPTAENVSRLDRARELIDASLRLLGAADSAGVAAFPAEGEPGGPRLHQIQPVVPFSGENREEAAKRLAAFDGRGSGHMPLYDAIEEAARGLRGRGVNQAVVVFTDGERSTRGGIDAAELARRLAASADRPRVFVVAIGERECDEPDIARLEEHDVMSRCYAASESTTDQLIGWLFADLRAEGEAR